MIKAKAEALEQQGIVEATVIERKAEAKKKEGLVEAEVSREKVLATAIGESSIIEKTAQAEATGIEVKAEAKRKEGLIEAEVTKEKALAEAAGIEEKAAAMKKLDGVGKEHEEFKLTLQKEKEVELAQIHIQKDIADAQAQVLGEALRNADIDIVGGETMFFENIVKQISNARGIDCLVNESDNLSQVKKALLGNDGAEGDLMERIRDIAGRLNISTADIKNLSIASLILKMRMQADNDKDKGFLDDLMSMAKSMGVSNRKL